MSVRTWLPLIALVCCVFLLNFSEFAPIGLLTDISKDFGISESTTGLIISVYAWAVAILSLPLMLLLRRMQYRPMLLMCIALFVVFQVITGLSNSYGMLMVSRLGVAVSHSIFWSIATPLAVAVVPMEYRKLAISAVAAGTSIAMIVGLPLGRIIGLALGWRMTFVFIAVIAMIALVFLIAMFPKVENPGTFTLRKLPTILKNPVLIGIYSTLILLVTGYYTGYSYIEPFLGTTAGLSETMITIVLTVFGLAGIVGSAAFTKLYDVVGFRFVIISLCGVLVCLLALLPSAEFALVLMIICAAWGFFVTVFNTAFQNEALKALPSDGSAVGMGLYSGLFNVGIAMGSIIGGIVTDSISIDAIGLVGAVFVACALVIASRYLAAKVAANTAG